MTTDFSCLPDALNWVQKRNQDQLLTWLENPNNPQGTLLEAMKHGVLLGGKRIRPFLVYATGQLLGAAQSDLDVPATAIECIHAYSLIHDDLPAMDDDELRRGQPTCHIVFNEAIAILAGDALQTLGFDILIQGQLTPQMEGQRIQMLKALSEASGICGMCQGQALDLEAENRQISLDALKIIHRHKTGALIRCAVRLGALASPNVTPDILKHLDQYADAIGLAFQVQDDILDVTSDTAILGKPQGSDEAKHKSTYPALLGLDGAQQKAQQLYKKALAALADIPYNTDSLAEFARFIIKRTH